MLRSLLPLLFVLAAVSPARADRYDDTLRLLGFGHEPLETVVENVLLSDSQRLAERLLSRIPDVHPRTAAHANQLDLLRLALLANPDRLTMPAPDRNMSLLASAVSGDAVDVVEFLLAKELDTTNEKEQLDRAIRENRLAVVKVYCRFERLNEMLSGVLHDACWQGRREIAKHMVEAGVPVTSSRTWGFQAVHAALFRKDLELVNLLIAKGAKVDPFVAAGLGREKTMTDLIEADGIESRFRNSVGPHPAFFAARTGQLATLRPFLTQRKVVSQAGHRGFNLIIAAAETANAETLTALIEAGVDWRKTGVLHDDKESRPIHFAAAAGNVDAAAALLEVGESMDVETERGSTPLILAAEFGHLAFCKFALENGAKIDAARNDTETALWVAAGRGRREIAAFLLDNGAKVDGVGKTPLRSAVIQNRVEVTRLLLERGANPMGIPTGADPKRVTITPLGLAASRNLKLVELFLERGQDPNRVQGNPADERTAVLDALQNFRRENVRLLLRAGGRVRPRNHAQALYWAGRNGDPDLVAALLESGVRLDAPTLDGKMTGLQRVLHGAIQADRKDVVQYVASLGYDLDVRLIGNDTPLGFATQQQARQAMIALLEAGADPNAQPFPGARKPVEIAMGTTGGFLSVRILVEHGAKPVGRGGLHLVDAAAAGNLHDVADLLDLGYGINGPLDGGEPLAAAARSGRTEVVAFLLERGADATLRDTAGRTALHAAAEAESNGVEVARRLAEEGVDPNTTDHNGQLPLHAAVAARRTEMIEFLRPRTTRLDLHLASALGDLEAVEARLAEDTAVVREERAPLGSPLFWAAAGGHSKVVERLLAAGGATPEFRDAMPRIVEAGDVELVDFLAQHGVSVNGPLDQYGEPLRIAIHSRRPELVRVLLKHGANPNARRSKVDWTLLQRAATRGLPEITQQLLDAGAHVNATGFDERSALDLALDPAAYATHRGENSSNTRGTVEGKRAVADALLEAGARARVGKVGKVAHAASLGEVELAQRLLETGGQVNGINERSGHTPLVAAIEGRRDRARAITDADERERVRARFVTLIETLLEAGADPALPATRGGTPLAAARRTADAELVRLIEAALEPKATEEATESGE